MPLCALHSRRHAGQHRRAAADRRQHRVDHQVGLCLPPVFSIFPPPSLSLSSLPPICAPLSLSLPPLLLSTYPPLSTFLLLLLPPRRSERHAAAPHQQHVRRRADHHRRLSPTEHGRTRVAGKCRRPRRGQRAGAGPLHLPRAAGVQVLLAPAARGPALRCALVCARRTFAKGTSISSRSTENGPAFP